MFNPPVIYYVMWIAGMYLISISMAMQTKNWRSFLMFRSIPFLLGSWILFGAFHFLSFF